MRIASGINVSSLQVMVYAALPLQGMKLKHAALTKTH
jgi:hypothetical protein